MIDFLSWLNSTFYDGLPYAIVTLSFVLTFKYIRFPDVTCAGSFVLGAAVAAATTVYFNIHPLLALVLACIAGALGGGLTAVFHILLRIDRLLAGILSAFMLYAVNLMILKPTLPYGNASTVLSGTTELDRSIVFGGVAWHPYTILLFAGVVIGAKLFLDLILASEFGLALRALEDEEAGPVVLRSLGLSPWRFQSFALTAGNALVALAGALVSMKEGAAKRPPGIRHPDHGPHRLPPRRAAARMGTFPLRKAGHAARFPASPVPWEPAAYSVHHPGRLWFGDVFRHRCVLLPY